ncbi:MAG: hypothetical protein JWN72_264, partial [Thermoleophilia bacterium]|nr:hypothetical protein [Thermoleophilia bacterium]
MSDTTSTKTGRVVEIKGVVLDVAFV